MKPGRLRGALSLPKIISVIIAGTIVLSLLFFTFWRQLNIKMDGILKKAEAILKEQFNQQQLMLAKKIADNVEAYFDYLESELLAYPWRFRLIPPDSPEFAAYMQNRFQDMQGMPYTCHNYLRSIIIVVIDGENLFHQVHAPVRNIIQSAHKRADVGGTCLGGKQCLGG